MFCPSCGKQLDGTAGFCSSCGSAVPYVNQSSDTIDTDGSAESDSDRAISAAAASANKFTANQPTTKKGGIGKWVAIAAVLIVAVMTFGGGGASPKNLEEYYEANPSEYQTLQQTASEIATSNPFLEKVMVDVKANQLSCYIVFPLQSDYLFGTEGLDWYEALGGASFLGQLFGFGQDVEAAIAEEIRQIEDTTGFKGVTEQYLFMDANGRQLYSVIYGSSGQI